MIDGKRYNTETALEVFMYRGGTMMDPNYDWKDLERQMTELDADPSFQESQRRHQEAFAFVMRSKGYLKSGDYETALYYADQAVETAPDCSTAYLARSYAYAYMNDPVHAEQDLLKMLEMDPDDASAQRLLNNLRRKTGTEPKTGGCLLPVIVALLVLAAMFLAI